MRAFFTGFLFCYAAGALPWSILMVRMHEPPLVVVYTTATWPHQLMRVATMSKVEDRR